MKLVIALLVILGVSSRVIGTDPLIECSANITQGTPWQIGRSFFNFAKLTVDTTLGLLTPNYNVDFTVDGTVLQTWDWNYTRNETNGFGGSNAGYWQSLYRSTQVDLGVILEASDNPFVDGLAFDGSPCTLGSPETVDPVGMTESATAAISIQNGTFIGTDGAPVELRGINYFGLEVPGNSFMDGLYAGTDSITKDFATVVYRFQLLGFNMVRLPFNFKNIFNSIPKSVTSNCNLDTQNTIAVSTRDPSSSSDPSTAPSPTAPAPTSPGQCSSSVPTDTMLDRFLYIMRYFAQNNFYLMIDDHTNYDTTAVENPTQWAAYWKQLAQAIANDPIIKPWVIYDILNVSPSFMKRTIVL